MTECNNINCISPSNGWTNNLQSRRLFKFNQFKDYEKEKSIYIWIEDADSSGSRTEWHVIHLPKA